MVVEDKELEVEEQEELETKEDELNPSDETQNTEEEEVVEKGKIPYDRFKQKVDEVNALKERLAKLEEAEEAKRQEELVEQERYKELYEAELEKNRLAEEARQEKDKEQALVKAGYGDDQIKFMLKLVEGESAEEVEESIKTLMETFPANGKKYVDPSVDNGERKTPKAKGGEELGRDTFKRLMGAGKLRGFGK